MDYFLESENKFNLSTRECQVLKLISKGWNNQKIADELVITIHTTKAHVASILRKMKVKNRTQAALVALREHIL